MCLQAVKNTSVYKVANPKLNICIELNNLTTEIVLLEHAYDPLPEGSFAPRRDHPEVLEPAQKINHWRELPITKSKQLWVNRVMPSYAALVRREGTKYDYNGATLVKWAGGVRVTGEELLQLEIVGEISGDPKRGFHCTTTSLLLQAQGRAHRDNAAPTTVVEVLVEGDIDHLIETAMEEKAAVAVDAPYTGDKFTVDETGHVIGDDGFRVPMNFEEFSERYPYYIRNWVKKRLHKNIVDQDVEDWEMELFQHMKYLPAESKHRIPGSNGRIAGCTDVVETFNPVKQYGASEKRFRNYINISLSNKFNTIMSKRAKNPVCRQGNYSIASQMDPENYEIVDEEYVHAHSENMMRSIMRVHEQKQQQLFLNEFRTFVQKNDPAMIQVMEVISITATYGEAQKELGMTEQDFTRARNRLRQLSECFQNAVPVPRQRRPYKNRKAVAV